MNLEEELNKIEEKKGTYDEKEEVENSKVFSNPLIMNYSDELPEKTEAAKQFEKAVCGRFPSIETGVLYHGNIKEINYYNDGYYRIQLLIDLYDKKNDENYHITQEYTFGGDYDDFNMKKLVNLLSSICNFQLNWIDSNSYESICESMQFLTEAKVSVIQRVSKNGKYYYEINVIGDYNSKTNRVE